MDVLEGQFFDMQLKIQSELKTSGVSPDVLVDSLTILPIALRAEYLKFVVDNLELLKTADSIQKIFHHLKLHFTFVDYRLLAHMIKKFGSTKLKQEISRYSEAMQVFIDETTVQQLLDHWHGKHEIPPHFEELQTVIGEDPSTYTLRQVDNLRKEFCSEAKLSETILVLIGVGKTNSFTIRWAVSSVYLTRLKAVIGDLKLLYQSEMIFSITLGRQRLYSIAAKYEERLLVLCAEGTGDIAEIQHLLNQPGIDTNIYDNKGKTPLWYASELGKSDLAQLLLECGAEIDLPNDDEWGSTALTAACMGGHVTTAALLINKGAKVDYVNMKGHHPLTLASYNGWRDVVILLLDHGAPIDLLTNDHLGATALWIACQQGHRDVAAVLIKRGATVDYLNKLHVTPLYMASQNGQDHVVQLLLDSGACVDKPNMDGCFTALWIASSAGHTNVVLTLIIKGANVNYQNKGGWTPLSTACSEGHADVVELLIQHGARLDIRDKCGHTPLDLALQFGHAKIVQILMNASDKVVGQRTMDVGGASPLKVVPSGNVNIPTEKVQVKLLETSDKVVGEKVTGSTSQSSESSKKMDTVTEKLNVLMDDADKVDDGRTLEAGGPSQLQAKPSKGITAMEFDFVEDEQKVKEVGRLKINDLDKVKNVLWGARTKWKHLGEALGMDPITLDAIANKRCNDSGNCLRDMLLEWLGGSRGPARVWSTILAALRKVTVDLGAIAEEIEREYNLASQSALHQEASHVSQSPHYAESLERSGQPHAEIGKLLDTVKAKEDEKTKEVVGDNIKKLEKQFLSLRKRFVSELEKDSKLLVGKILDSLTCLPITLRAEYEKAVSYKMEAFKKAADINQIFHHLNDLFSFIDYNLLQFLIEEFGSEQLQRDMSSYDVATQAFLDETTVEQLMVHWPAEHEIPPDMEEIRMVIDKHPSEYTLRQLDELRKEFSGRMRLYKTLLILNGVGKENSFLISWAAPSMYVSQLKLVIGTLGKFYKQHDVISVTFCKQQFYSIAAVGERTMDAGGASTSEKDVSSKEMDIVTQKLNVLMDDQDKSVGEGTMTSEQDMSSKEMETVKTLMPEDSDKVDEERTLEAGGTSVSQKIDQLQAEPPQPPKEVSEATAMEFDFVERPSEEFFCPVTFELLLEPYLTTCCGNHLSHRAVTRLKQEKKPCPICKEPELATVLDKFHRRKVCEVKVHCPHTPNGCEWVGEVGHLKGHTETCLRCHVNQPPDLEPCAETCLRCS